ncbi:MAG: membrane protein insertion efficiency factor YidD [Kiritimatiellae bacterium]|nr:membrane protein insertion efficiency factor YidD [Kiritimatiellia bacterium]
MKPLLLPLASLVAALAALPAPAAEPDRLARRAALVAELLEEGAVAEARAEASRLRAEPFWRDGALDAVAPRLAAAAPAQAAPPPDPATGSGSLFARGVVGFYRFAVGPALGQRCALEPSCSRYFVLASRKHGWLGVPMTADRFVREPVVSAPDRPWVRNSAGAWRHPDPVEDHDWWFGR